MSTISVCLIVKNEEEMLKQCLENVKDFSDEVIIVDTGSTDKTKEVAAQYGDKVKVFDFPWIDDFSAARNEWFKYATKEWILFLDADEIIAPESKDALRKIIRDNQKQLVYNVSIKNITDGDVVMSRSFRLFPNNPGCKFINPVHEVLTMPKECQASMAAGVTIIHYGYLGKHKVRKGTNERNLRILLKAEESDPKKYYYNYYIAQQYYLLRKLDIALEYYNKALKLLTENPCTETGIFTPLIYVGLAKTHSELNHLDEMLKLSKVDTTTPDFYIELGTYFCNQKKYNDALQMYEKTIAMKDSKNLASVYDQGSMTWKAYAGLGSVYIALNLPIKAIDNFKLSLLHSPKNEITLKLLASLHGQIGDFTAAEEYINKLIEINPTPQYQIDLANIYVTIQRKKLKNK